MAETKGDKRAGRMLFTDFDASGKGRPVAALDDVLFPDGARPGSFPGRPLPTIEELAASLGLDFEDDGGGQTGRHERPSPPEPERGDDSAPRASLVDDDERIATEYPDIRIPAFDGRDVRPQDEPDAPTWDEVTYGFRRSGEKPAVPSTAAMAAEIAAESNDYARYPTDRYPAVQPEPPGGGIPEDGDFDILSAIPPGEPGEAEDDLYRPHEGDWRGHRLGLDAPRGRPYGGVKRLDDWYRPPATTDEPGEHTVERIDDWYEPPEEYMPGDPARMDEAPRDRADEPLPDERREHDAESLERGKTRIGGERWRGSGTTSNLDIFSDLDMEALWQEKLLQRKNTQEERHTATQDIFADLNLDEVWEKKREFAGPAAAQARPDSTVIFNPDLLGGDATVVVPTARLDPDRKLERATRERRKPAPTPEPAPRRPTRAVRGDSPPAAADTAFDFLDDSEIEFDSSLLFQDPPAAEAEAAGKKRPLPHEVDTVELNLDDLIAEADAKTSDEISRSAIAVPVIGNDAIVSVRGDKGAIQSESAEEADTAGRSGGGDNDEFPIPDDVHGDVVGDGDLAMPTGSAPAERPGDGEDGEKAGSGNSAGADSGAAGAVPEEMPVEVDPMDVFANLDNMEFSDGGLDDEMKAMLDEGKETPPAEADGANAAPARVRAKPPPSGFMGRVLHATGKVLDKVLPKRFLARMKAMIAWRENWWFYCDLLAAIIASASLAVIISYFVWYR